MAAEKNKKNSDAKIQANNRYSAKAYDRINIIVPKGKKALIAEKASAQGDSMNQYVNKAIDAYMGEDTEQKQ